MHSPALEAGKIVTKIFRSTNKWASSIIYLQRFIDISLLYLNLKRLSEDSYSCYNINLNEHDSLADINSTDRFYDETISRCNRQKLPKHIKKEKTDERLKSQFR